VVMREARSMTDTERTDSADAEAFDLETELERRLSALTAPDFDEPARAAFERRDFVAIAIFVLLSCAAGFAVLP